MPRRRDEDLIRDIGRRIATLRQQRGFTQERLAERIGIEPVTLSRLETGNRAVSISSASRMADALGVGLGDLLDVQRPLPESEQPPEAAELVREFTGLSAPRRDLVLRLVRELARVTVHRVTVPCASAR